MSEPLCPLFSPAPLTPHSALPLQPRAYSSAQHLTLPSSAPSISPVFGSIPHMPMHSAPDQPGTTSAFQHLTYPQCRWHLTPLRCPWCLKVHSHLLPRAHTPLHYFHVSRSPLVTLNRSVITAPELQAAGQLQVPQTVFPWQLFWLICLIVCPAKIRKLSAIMSENGPGFSHKFIHI